VLDQKVKRTFPTGPFITADRFDGLPRDRVTCPHRQFVVLLDRQPAGARDRFRVSRQTAIAVGHEPQAAAQRSSDIQGLPAEVTLSTCACGCCLSIIAGAKRRSWTLRAPSAPSPIPWPIEPSSRPPFCVLHKERGYWLEPIHTASSRPRSSKEGDQLPFDPRPVRPEVRVGRVRRETEVMT
jgi:hypothetical protein